MKTEAILEESLEHVLYALTPANRRVCRVCLHTGLRVSDVLHLESAQLSKQRFWVTEQKTGKRRMIGIPEPLYSDLRKHMGVRWVFPGRNPLKPRTRQAVWKDLKRAAVAFRIKENLAPHSMRKIYARELMTKYGSIEKVRKALNHDRYTTTMLYLMADRLVMPPDNLPKLPSLPAANRGGKDHQTKKGTTLIDRAPAKHPARKRKNSPG